MNFRTITSISNKKYDDNLPKYESNQFKPRKKNSSLLSMSSLSYRQKRIIRTILVGIVCIFGIFKILSPNDNNGPFSSLLGRLFDGGLYTTVEYYDLRQYQGTKKGWEHNERLLMCIPLRNAQDVLPMMFSHLDNLTYSHHLIDLAFLVSDSTDNTLNELYNHLQRYEAASRGKREKRFNEVSVFEKDFGQVIGQGFDDRHGVTVQGARRKIMGRARNWLLSMTLKPYHSWVYWRDADIETAPPTLIEDLMRHGRDVIVPSMLSLLSIS